MSPERENAKILFECGETEEGSLNCGIDNGTIILTIERNAIDINDRITYDEVMIYDDGGVRYLS